MVPLYFSLSLRYKDLLGCPKQSRKGNASSANKRPSPPSKCLHAQGQCIQDVHKIFLFLDPLPLSKFWTNLSTKSTQPPLLCLLFDKPPSPLLRTSFMYGPKGGKVFKASRERIRGSKHCIAAQRNSNSKLNQGRQLDIVLGYIYLF